MNNFEESWTEYLNDDQQYWAKKMEYFTWFSPYEKIFDSEVPHYPKWFVGGKMNLCYDCLDRKVKEGFGEKIAYIFDSNVTNASTYYTYNELLYKVSRLSGALVKYGVSVGDNVVICMPTIIETLISMLAVCRIGAVFNVLIGDYSEEVIANRIDDLKVKVAIVCNAEFDGVNVRQTKVECDRANEFTKSKITKCIVLQRPQFPAAPLIRGRDVEFEEAIRTSEPHECIPVEANSPMFLIFTSGTTGKPKGVIQSVRGVAASIIQDMGNFMGLGECNVVYLGSCYAWMTGILYNCFMPLLYNITSLLYEGSLVVPDVKEVYRLLSTHKVETYYAPNCVLRILRHQDPLGNIAQQYQPFHLKKVYSGSVPGDRLTMEWAQMIFQLPVPQLYGSTEAGGNITLPNLSRGRSLYDDPVMCSSYPAPGMNVRILREDGSEAGADEVGKIVLKAPYNPTIASSVFMNHELFVESYFKSYQGYFDTKDVGKLDKEGRLYVYSRSDDVFKAGGGNKVSCNAIEDVILQHQDVTDCIVTTKLGDDHGSEIHIPIPFIIIKKGAMASVNQLLNDVVEMVHRELGNFIPLEKPFICDSLPRTASGKLKRGILKMLVNCDERKLQDVNQPELQQIKSVILASQYITDGKVSA